MKLLNLIPVVFLALACSCGGGGKDPVPESASITLSPSSFSCDEKAQTGSLSDAGSEKRIYRRMPILDEPRSAPEYSLLLLCA